MADITAVTQWAAFTAATDTLDANSTDPDVATTAILENWLQSVINQVGDWQSAGTVASASTTDIGAEEEHYLSVSGTTTITGLGTVAAGTLRILTFEGALTFTHNGTSLILPGAADITTAAGDVAVMVSLGSGNWRCVSYQQAAKPVNANVLDTVVKVLTADADSTSTVFANVTGLGVTVNAGETWEFEFDFWASMTNNAADAEVAFNGPTASTLSFMLARMESSGATATTVTPVTSYDATGQVAALTNTRTFCTIRGRVTFTAAGTFIPRLRRSAAAGTATIKENSVLRCNRVP